MSRARLLLVVFLALPALAAAAALDRLRTFLRDTQAARATFTQTVTDRNGRVVQKSNGEFQLLRPGRFRWTVDKPFRQVVVGDGERVWIYDEDLNQVIVRKASEALGSTPAALLAGREDVEKSFKWRELGTKDGLEWLAATPIAKESAFAEIRLGFDVNGLSALELTDAFGQSTHVHFSGLASGAQPSPDAFRFVPPKGADVIGEK